MKNPCEQCLVKVMCGDPCEDMIDHFKKMLYSYLPKKRANIHETFPKGVCQDIKNEPTKDINFAMAYLDHNKQYCTIIVEGGVIKEICERRL